MALFLPPALTMPNLKGGYDSHLDFTEMADNQTQEGKNTTITPTTVEQRLGYVRMLNTALTKTGLRETTGLSAVAVRGHYQLKKSGRGTETKVHCVAAGPNLWSYGSANASAVITGLTDEEDAIWNFVQIQDPSEKASGTDDILIGVNGYDSPVIWNGTDASASYLSSVAGSSGVMPAKYIITLKNRVALLNIQDPSDVDAKSKFLLSPLIDGVPHPHVFPSELAFYVGGSDKYGGITGAAALNGKIVIFKKNTFYTFNVGGAVDQTTLALVHDFSLKQIDENIGCVAPRSIVSLGNVVLFLSDKGIYAYDGTNLVHISKAIDNDLENINFARKKYAAGGFNRADKLYYLAFSPSGKNSNEVMFTYDVNEKKWYPPSTGMRCDIISNYIDASQEKVLCGDQKGYVYELNKGLNDGKELGYNLVPASLTGGDTVTFYDSQSIDADGDGLLGLNVRALGSTGANALPREITASTGTQVTVSPGWGSDVNSNTTICLLGIDSYLQTKDYDLGSPDLTKFFREANPRYKQYGDIDMNVNYIVDFNDMSKAATATVSQYDENYVYFTAGDFATGTEARFSGTVETVSVGACSITLSAGSDTSASSLVGYGMYFWNSGTRYVWPIATGECDVIGIGNYGTASLVATDTKTTYLINTNLVNAANTAKWGQAKPKKANISLRSLYTQQNAGEHFALRFGNKRANEKWGLYGFDIVAKNMGRR